MKISNPDVIQLTEIKQYFVEPPLSFKLSGYALERLEKALGVLQKYPFVKPSDIEVLETLHHDIEKNKLSRDDLKMKLKEAGIMIAKLNNR